MSLLQENIPAVVAAVVVLIGLFWLIKRSRSGSAGSEDNSAEAEIETAKPVEKRSEHSHHHGHRHRHHKYSRRNPTISTTGGLPPIREPYLSSSSEPANGK